MQGLERLIFWVLKNYVMIHDIHALIVWNQYCHFADTEQECVHESNFCEWLDKSSGCEAIISIANMILFVAGSTVF